MTRFTMTLLTSFLVSAVVVSPAQAQGKTKPTAVTPEREWVEIIRDEEIAKKAPRDGLITDAKSFAALWKAFRKDEKQPEFDFKKQFVLVTLSLGGPNKPRLRATLDEEGKLTTIAFSTKIGGPGFGYSIALFNRGKIKSVNGKELK